MSDPHNGTAELLIQRAATLYRLKDLRRTGWVLRGITEPESVADHSWGTALLALLFLPLATEPDAPLDRERVLSIALVHDLAEAETGDIPRRALSEATTVTMEEKHRREEAAIRRLTEIPEGLQREGEPVLPGVTGITGIAELWYEYEAGTTRESRFVRDMNLVDMCLQAVVYEEGARYDPRERAADFPDFPGLEEFFETSRDRFRTALGRSLYRSLYQRYHQWRKTHYTGN
ncbi:MAG: HD domain-containing protein [Alkalispirochaeta sp.]